MRIGIDLGGTKIEGIAMGDASQILFRKRVPTPHGNYQATLGAIAALVSDINAEAGPARSIGIGAPGSINPAGDMMQNCNSTCLNGENLAADLQARLTVPTRIANDADCFVLSEANDGAAKDCNTVFGVILGTGVGGGYCVGRKLIGGPNALTGEWGHNPLARSSLHQPNPDHPSLDHPSLDHPRLDLPGPDQSYTSHAFPDRPCFCGRVNCVETWISGPAVEKEFHQITGKKWSAADISSSADPEAIAATDRFLDRLAQALGVVINMIDPDCIVFGGGLSHINRIYSDLPHLITRHILPETCHTKFVKASHGDSSGVRGAAWLWP
jgi:fructokinase